MRKVGIWLGALLSVGVILVALKRDTSVPKPTTPPDRVTQIADPRTVERTLNWTNAAARFAEASVAEQRETFDAATGEKTLVEIVKTPGKYPHIRVETEFRFDAQLQAWVPRRPIEYVADQVLVELKPGVTDKQLESALEKIKGRVILKHAVGDSSLVLIGLPKPAIEAVPNALSALRQFPNVFEIVEPHLIRRASATPNDPSFSEQWALQNIRAEAAWDIQRGKASVVVAVLDSGIDYNHPDLAARVWSNPGEKPGNLVDDDRNGYMDDYRGMNFAYENNNPYDDNNHGTFLSGIIGAAGNDARGIAGVCWDVRIMPVKIMDSRGLLYAIDEIRGFDYARLEGAKIVNASFGGYYFSQSEYNAIVRLRNSGVLFVAAAGNDGFNNDIEFNYPSSHTLDNVLAVTYSDVFDVFSPRANYGPVTVDLAAPGVNVFSTLRGGTYTTSSGSSFAAPHVAGVAALLKAQGPGRNYSQLKSMILNNTDLKAGMMGRTVSGGRLNAYEALLPRVPLSDALESGTLVWQTGGARPWFGQTLESSDGVDAARCGNITDGQVSWLETTVTGPGQLTFNWKASCELPDFEIYYDYLQFTMDSQASGPLWAVIGGETGWESKSFNLPTGTHALRWTYVKGLYNSEGADKVWLDNVSYVRDTGGPTITITDPLGTNLYATDVLLQGTASDIFGVTQVECRIINDAGLGPWQTVNSSDGFATWNVQLSGLSLGTNLVRFRAVDGLSQTSAVNRVYMVLTPLITSVTGCGTLNPDLSGTTWHEAGKTLSIRAVPCPGHLFLNWSGDVSSENALLSVVMQPNLTLQANFIPNPFIGVTGFYNGLFHEPAGVLHESSGLFKGTLWETGAVSGFIVLSGATNTFSAKLDPTTGSGVLSIPRAGKSSVLLTVQAAISNATDQITGQISDGIWTADLVADRLVFNPTNNPPPFAKMYTLVFPGSQDFTVSPSGHGFATATLNTSGRISIDGRMGDNARVLQTIPVSKNGDWPLYLPLYPSNRGSVLGWLKLLLPPGFTNQLTSWIRPTNPVALYYASGFSNELTVLGSPYQVPTTNRVIDCTNALLTLSGADFLTPITNNVVLTSSNTVVNGGPYNMSVKIVRTNGTFSGSLILPRRTNAFQGVFLQQQNIGLGYFIGSNYIGEVRFEPVQ